MSYQVLARKWRPRGFADMVGQEHVLRILTGMLESDRVHHAYLFTGTRGVGKTSLARILAKCLNCEQGVTAAPCCRCSNCTSIDEGHFIDLIEVDAASRARVDETRALMDNVQYTPSTGRYKVYLIDEVHMFSGHSFNALLKTLEEPPEHVKFLLATTDANKIPVTILSRCLQFNLKHLSADQIEAQLVRILQAESVDSDAGSRRLLAESAAGSMRDALSLLDQAIAHGGGHLREDNVRDMLGAVNHTDMHELLEALAAADMPAALKYADDIAAHDPDYDLILVELLSLLQQLAVYQSLGEGLPKEDEDLRELSRRISAEDVQLYYQIALMGRKDLPYAPDQPGGFAMILIRMLAFRPAAAKTADNQGGQDNPRRAAAPAAAKTADKQGGQGDPRQVAADDDWQQLVAELPLSGLLRQLAHHCALKGRQGDRWRLALPPGNQSLLNDDRRRRLEAMLRQHLGEGARLEISIEDSPLQSMAQKGQQQREEESRLAKLSLANDSNVNTIKEVFSAELDESSISPVAE